MLQTTTRLMKQRNGKGLTLNLCAAAMSAYGLLSANYGFAQDSTSGGRHIPSYSLPAPSDVSPELRNIISAPPSNFNMPEDKDSLQKMVNQIADAEAKKISALRAQLGIKMKQGSIAGVNVFTLTPKTVAPENENRVFLHFHGGGFLLFPGESGTREAALMAAFGHAKVISIDYTTSSYAPYPAALNEAISVYREVLKSVPDSRHIAVFGSSAGGNLAMALVLRAKQDGLPLPGAVGLGSPFTDFNKIGDTYNTLKNVDNFLVQWEGAIADHYIPLYANNHDLTNPSISPIYGDLTGFPPTVLISGTRDLLLSLTVRTHRALRRAGVESELQVFEGISHVQYLMVADAPETREAFEEFSGFFNRHMPK